MKHKYSFLLLVFAVLFVMGSMGVTNGILKLRERQILTESGRAKVESPVLEQTWAGGKETDGEQEDDFGLMAGGESELSVQQVKEAMAFWMDRDADILHEPAAGQISMEKAIENGKEWISQIGVFEVNWEEISSFSVNASLRAAEKWDLGDAKREPYFSFWSVDISAREFQADLLLNAVTGKVWQATVSTYFNVPAKLKKKNAVKFWELAGLPVRETDIVEVKKGKIASYRMAEDDLFAVIRLTGIKIEGNHASASIITADLL